MHAWFFRLAVALLALAGAATAAAAPAPAYDTILRGGTVYDGGGGPGRRLDVGIRGDRIAAIGNLAGQRARAEIDATGMAVAPGFINMLSWSTESLLVDGESHSDLRQGVTLELLGEGMTMGPLNPKMQATMRARMARQGVDAGWSSLAEYMALLEQRGVVPNVASFVGATNMRLYVIGNENRKATPEELAAMQELVRTAMQQGALGISSALAYAPAMYADTDELIALCKAAAPYGGIYISHLRDEGDRLVESVDELIRIAGAAGVPGEIYHLKAWGAPNWSKLQTVIQHVEQARAKGLRIGADMYPYTASASGLDLTMPGWVQEGGLQPWLERLKDPALRARLVEEVGNSPRLAGPDAAGRIRILSVKNPALQPLVGKTIAEVAQARGVSPAEAVIDLIAEDGSRLGVAYFAMSEENVRRIVALPWVSFGSDAGSEVDTGKPGDGMHPRAFGTFARVLGKYVRDERVVPLSEAIRRMSAMPAATLGIRERGMLKRGWYADLVVFDPATVGDRATFENPRQYAAGMRDVFVNGVRVLSGGEPTGAKPGRFVRGAKAKT